MKFLAGSSARRAPSEALNSQGSGVMRKRNTLQRVLLLLFVSAGSIRCGSSEQDPPSPLAGNRAETGGAAVAAGGASINTGGSGFATGGSGGRGVSTGGVASGGRPSPNEWTPGFPLGAPGWKDSSQPFCDVNRGRLSGTSVWADSRGVFALVSEDCILVGRDLPYCPPESRLTAGVSLHFNDGTGWRVLLDDEVYSAFDLTGFEGGALLVGQPTCAAALIDVNDGTTTCSLPGMSGAFERRSFVVNESLAYVVDSAGLHEYRAGAWSREVTVLPEKINAVWANEEIVYLAGEYQLYSWAPQQNAQLHPLPDAPAASYTTAWGFASNDVWFGNSVGQLTHYDGQGFTRSKIPKEIEYPAITALWGSADQLFFSMFDRFGRVASGELETLLGMQTLSFWGTSPQDLFLAVQDSAFDDTACGAALLLHFDGTEFHRF
jgi:hypothetical protein